LLPVPVLPLHRQSVDGRLLMNYCYGHEYSDIVLYPYSPMSNYINHDGVQPNARLRWRYDYDNDDDDDDNNNGFPSADSMIHDQPPGLLLELVAIRTIRAGEQVTMDYGRSWEAAWEQHVTAWNATRNQGGGSTSTTTDDKYMYPDDPSLTIRTEAEQQQQPYAPNLQTVCYRYDDDDDNVDHDVEPSIPSPLLQRRLHPSRLEPCRILERRRRPATAAVTVTADDGDDNDVNVYYRVEFTSDASPKTIARRFITFTDKPGMSDQALTGAFRHVIGLDDIFPHKWLRHHDNSNRRGHADSSSSNNHHDL
jgi:SET domain